MKTIAMELLWVLVIAIAGRAAHELSETLPSDANVGGGVFLELPVLALPVGEVEVLLKVAWPIDADDYVALSSPFGERDPATVGGYGDDYHDGLDLYGTWRARIRAGADAYVACVFPAPNGYYRGHPVLGGVVILRASISEDTYYLVYGHLSSTEVAEDEVVSVGALLGRQGNTGHSDGAHLHFGLNRGGTLDVATGEITGGMWLNPLKYMVEPGSE